MSRAEHERELRRRDERLRQMEEDMEPIKKALNIVE